MRKFFIAVGVAALLSGGFAAAGSLYSWSSGEIVTSTQLNANFAHIHNNMVGGHGPRLVNADVSASAAIASSKLAGYRLIPTAWAKVGAGSSACSTGTCTLDDSSGVTSVTHGGTGVYTVTVPTQGDTVFAVIAASQTADVVCGGIAASATTATVTCRTVASSPGASDAVFSFLILDNN